MPNAVKAALFIYAFALPAGVFTWAVACEQCGQHLPLAVAVGAASILAIALAVIG